MLFKRMNSGNVRKINPDTSRIKNNSSYKNTKVYEEFSLEKVKEIYQENKKKKDLKYEKEINKMIDEFKKFIINKIYSKASIGEGNIYIYILKDDFINIFGKKYEKGYYPKVAKEIVLYLQNYGFYVPVCYDESIKENENVFVNWVE